MSGSQTGQQAFRLLTPRGRGAIAAILVQGPGLDQVFNRLLRTAANRSLAELNPGQFVYGTWQAGISSGEDVVVCKLSDEAVEIYSHGGTAVVAAIGSELSGLGFVELSEPECWARAGNRLWKMEVGQALVSALTQKTALLLLHQLNRLPAAIDEIIQLLKNGESGPAATAVEQILSWQDFGCRLAQPRSVVLFGSPNVGKSSLVNAIVGFNRVIVHDTPGTTRDSITELTALDGWPCAITDTAGIRATAETVEELGIEGTQRRMAQADVLVHVTDVDSDTGETAILPAENGIQPGIPLVSVCNKADLRTPWPSDYAGGPLHVSARTGQGIDDLVQLIGARLVGELPPPDQAVPVTQLQVTRLRQALERVRSNQLDQAIEVLDEPATV